MIIDQFSYCCGARRGPDIVTFLVWTLVLVSLQWAGMRAAVLPGSVVVVESHGGRSSSPAVLSPSLSIVCVDWPEVCRDAVLSVCRTNHWINGIQTTITTTTTTIMLIFQRTQCQKYSRTVCMQLCPTPVHTCVYAPSRYMYVSGQY